MTSPSPCYRTIAELLDRNRRCERPAFVDQAGRTYDYHWLCTTSWQAGNALRHTGIRRGVSVGIVGEGPFALLAFLGTALLEGMARFDPPTSLRDDDSVRTLVAPSTSLDAYDLPVGTQRVGYGEKSTSPDVHHFERVLWSENPSFPPTEIDRDCPVLTTGEEWYSHGSLLDAAKAIIDAYDIDDTTCVAIREPLSIPGTVVAGVLVPLVVGGSFVLPGGTDSNADVVVTTAIENASDEVHVDPTTVSVR